MAPPEYGAILVLPAPAPASARVIHPSRHPQPATGPHGGFVARFDRQTILRPKQTETK
jgi:hypothetical protein